MAAALPGAASPITGLANADIDFDTLPDPGQSESITAWFESTTANGIFDNLVIKNSSSALGSEGFGAAGNGTNILGFNGGPPNGLPGTGYAYQQIGSYTPGERIQVTGEALRRDSHDFANFTIGLYVGSGVAADGIDVATFATLADSAGVLGSDLGLRVNSSFTFASTGVGAAGTNFEVVLDSGVSGTPGDPLWVRFSADTVGEYVGVYLDNLSVASAVPEPSTFVLAILGVSSLTMLRRCKRGGFPVAR
jgi:hypothetical protein